MTQIHLIPPAVKDCVDAMLSDKVNIDARNNYEQRVEAIRIFCEDALKKLHTNRKLFDRKYAASR